MTNALAPVAYMRDRLVPIEQASLNVASAPMLYGLSIYTVLMVRYDSKTGKQLIFRMPEHWQRLQQSARIMDFGNFLETWDYQRFSGIVEALLAANPATQDMLLRISVFIDELMSGTRMRGLKNNLTMFLYPFEPLLDPSGAHLGVSSWQRTNDAAIPARAKNNGSYANSSLIKNEALLNGFDDAVSLDERGHVCESSVANIFLVRDEKLITPDNASSILEGITRRSVIQVAENLGISVESRAVDRSELYIADEIFLSGSSARLTPILSIDHRPVGRSIGPLTNRLMKKFEQITTGQDEAYRNWLTIL